MVPHLLASAVKSCFLLGLFGYVTGYDRPCAARWIDDKTDDTGLGSVCVCNSTYCDTISPPETLEGPLYHHYVTSNSSPGFTHTIGVFHQGNDKGNDADTVVITIDPAVVYQEIVGFGGSFTDTSGMLIRSLPEGAQRNMIESYFGPTGIEYTMGRLPMGSTDFSPYAYTYDEYPTPDVDLQHFNLSQCDHDNKIPIIQAAMTASVRGLKLIGCSWQAPSWMKVNSTMYAGYIAQEYHHQYAMYQIKFLEAYKEHGIDLWSLSGGNEIVTLMIIPLPTGMLNCTYSMADGQSQWIKNHLKPLLMESSFSHIKVLGLEDMRPFAKYYMDTMALEPEAYAAIDGVAVHWYLDSYFSTKILDDYHASHPDKLIIYSETSCNGQCGEEAVQLGSWYRANIYAFSIMENLNNWANGYIDWNLALDENGGPSRSFDLDAPVIINQTSGEFYKQPMFYAMGHFSKFVQPGAKRIKTVSNQDTLAATTKSDPSWEDLKKVLKSRFKPLREKSDPPVPLPIIQVPQIVFSFATTNPDESVTVILLNAKNVTQQVRVEDSRMGSIVLDLEEYSLNSFIYWP